MGYFSNMQVEEQNPPMATGGRIEGLNSIREDGTVIPLSVDEYGCPPYVINARQAEKYAPILAVINRPRVTWHEGEGCSGNACCCDQTELEIV